LVRGLVRRLVLSAAKPNTQAVAQANRAQPSRLRLLGFLRQRQPTNAVAVIPFSVCVAGAQTVLCRQ
jgi:hypothetical protein